MCWPPVARLTVYVSATIHYAGFADERAIGCAVFFDRHSEMLTLRGRGGSVGVHGSRGRRWPAPAGQRPSGNVTHVATPGPATDATAGLRPRDCPDGGTCRIAAGRLTLTGVAVCVGVRLPGIAAKRLRRPRRDAGGTGHNSRERDTGGDHHGRSLHDDASNEVVPSRSPRRNGLPVLNRGLGRRRLFPKDAGLRQNRQLIADGARLQNRGPSRRERRSPPRRCRTA